MPLSFGQFFVRGLVLFFVPQLLLSADAQNSITNHVLSPIANLRQLIRDSGYIFDGTVVSVTSVGQTEASSIETVQITFRIEQAILGTRKGQLLTIREWAGLWNAGERYRAGERLLLFLHRPSKLGLTSPVGGSRGRFPVNSAGNVIFEKIQPTVPAINSAGKHPLRESMRMSSRALALAVRRQMTE